MAIPILVKELKTGKVHHVASVQDAAKMTGVSATAIYHGFYSGLKTVKDGMWTFSEDNSNEAEHSAANCKPVIRINTLTGEEVWFKSVKASAQATFVSESTVHCQLTGRSKVTRTGYTWRYADNEQGAGQNADDTSA